MSEALSQRDNPEKSLEFLFNLKKMSASHRCVWASHNQKPQSNNSFAYGCAVSRLPNDINKRSHNSGYHDKLREYNQAQGFHAAFLVAAVPLVRIVDGLQTGIL